MCKPASNNSNKCVCGWIPLTWSSYFSAELYTRTHMHKHFRIDVSIGSCDTSLHTHAATCNDTVFPLL